MFHFFSLKKSVTFNREQFLKIVTFIGSISKRPLRAAFTPYINILYSFYFVKHPQQEFKKAFSASPFQKKEFFTTISKMENEFNFDSLSSLKNKKSEPIIVYTDGGCHGNPGPGGWACVIIANGEARQLSGGEKLTTNNKMELTAAISALSAIYNTERLRPLPVELNIDSQYVKNGITGWIFGWKKNGWKTANKKPVLNRDLWEKLDALNSALNVEWRWVKGHAGVEYNEVCDQLCQKEIAKFE